MSASTLPTLSFIIIMYLSFAHIMSMRKYVKKHQKSTHLQTTAIVHY